MTSTETSHDPAVLFCAIGSETTALTEDDLRDTINSFLESLGPRNDVLLIPPDFTRFHSQAGILTRQICEYYNYIPATASGSNNGVACPQRLEILPALGTHAPVSQEEKRRMFGDALAEKDPSPFLVHDWRNDVVTIGHAPAAMVETATHGMIKDRPWPAQLNKTVWAKRKSLHNSNNNAEKDDGGQHPPPPPLVLSIGQVVPHEVMGMANFNKNLFVGTGGVDAINLSHFIGAVHGMENMMGRKDNPLRSILNHASTAFLEKELDLWYVLTVVAPDAATGNLCVRGLYIGRDIQCYSAACDLSLRVNFTLMDKPIQRCVVYLDPDEFRSTWLGNKAIYRTRMAMADGGQLIILAPGLERFGEDARVDALIRKHGYHGTPATMKAMEDSQEMRDNLSAVAHLIHGSSEGRFRITYCPGHLTRKEMEDVGFEFAELEAMQKRYDTATLKNGWHKDEEGEFFFINNPALGLWALRSRFDDASNKDK